MRGLLCMMFVTIIFAQSTGLNTPASDQAVTLANQLFSNPDFIAAFWQALLQNQAANSVVKTNPCTQTINNICVSCSSNYALKNGVCTLSSISTNSLGSLSVTQPIASAPSSSSTTLAQSTQSTASLPGLVTESNSQSNQNGAFLPFYVINTPVTFSNQFPNPYTDNNCKTINQLLNICDECFVSFYFSRTNNSCIPTNPLCQNVTKNNQCTACFTGYTLTNGQCIQNKNITSIDQNCKAYQAGICRLCYDGYYIGSANVCLKANSTCKTVNSDNQCTSCYDNYLLISNICYLKVSADQFCTNFTNGVCASCANRYYLSYFGICTEVDRNCDTYTNQGVCTECYIGFIIKNGACKVQTLTDLIQNISSGVRNNNSVKCGFRSYPLNGLCMQVDMQCQTWNQKTGACQSCYGGYKLVEGGCLRN